MTVHNLSTQYKKFNSSDNLPSYLQTNITAQMLSIRGEGDAPEKHPSRTQKGCIHVDFMTFAFVLE